MYLFININRQTYQLMKEKQNSIKLISTKQHKSITIKISKQSVLFREILINNNRIIHQLSKSLLKFEYFSLLV